MKKIYAVVLMKDKTYEVFNEWEHCVAYIEKHPKKTKQIASFPNSKDGHDKLLEFVSYCIKGTTYNGRRIAESMSTVYLVGIGATVDKKKYSSFTINYKGNEVITMYNLVQENSNLTAEQYAILQGLEEIVNMYPIGTEILIGVSSDYLINLFLDFNEPSSSSTKHYSAEFNKLTSDYIVEVVKAENYMDSKTLLKKLKTNSKKRRNWFW